MLFWVGASMPKCSMASLVTSKQSSEKESESQPHIRTRGRGGDGSWGDVWVLLGRPRALGKAPPTFQGPLWVGQPGEGGSLGEVPLDPLVGAGSFVDLWGWGRAAEPGVPGRPGLHGLGRAERSGSHPTRPRGVGARKQRQAALGVSTRCKKTPLTEGA